MNKNILAAAMLVALTSGSAFAGVNVYDKEGVKVDLGGAAEVQLFQGYEYKGQDVKQDIRLDDGNLNFNTTVEITDDLKALAFFDFDFEKGAHSNSDLYVGLQSKTMGTIKAGRTVTVYDDTGISEDIEFGLTGHKDVTVFDSGEDAVRYDLNLGNVYFALATDIEEKDGASSHVDGKVGVKGEMFDVRVFAQSGEEGTKDTDAYALEASLSFDKVGLAAGYYVAENKDGNAKVGFNTLSISTTYSMETVTLAGGVNLVEGTDDIKKFESTNYYMNVTKKLHSNVKVYGEVGLAEVNNDDAVGYVVGMEVKF